MTLPRAGTTLLLELLAGCPEFAAQTYRDMPFVVVDCGSIPHELIASELFGHARGSFTGASGDKQGLIEAANGGTLFLDEIGELALAVQRFVHDGRKRGVQLHPGGSIPI